MGDLFAYLTALPGPDCIGAYLYGNLMQESLWPLEWVLGSWDTSPKWMKSSLPPIHQGADELEEKVL